MTHRCRNTSDAPVAVQWSVVDPTNPPPSGAPVLAVHTIEPGEILGIDETAQNGHAVHAIMYAAGLVDV